MRRSRDLYELGDLSKADSLARRDAIQAQLAQLTPRPVADLDQARQLLEDFEHFWATEPNRETRRQLIARVFERVWLDDHHIVAVRANRDLRTLLQPAKRRAEDV